MSVERTHIHDYESKNKKGKGQMREIRIHGRGGQGAVTAAKVLASAFVVEGKFASAFPMYATERRGAPVAAFLRFDDKIIRQRTQVYEPDCLLILGSDLLHAEDIFDGLKRGGTLVINTTKPDEVQRVPNITIVGSLDANRIAQEEIGRAITNTCMLGAFARTTGWLQVDSILSILEGYLGAGLLKENQRCVKRGFYETEVINYEVEYANKISNKV